MDLTLASPPRPRPSRAAAALLTALLVAVTWAVAPTSARADDDVAEPYALSQCTSGRFCLWSGAVYTGSFFSTTSTSVVGTGNVSRAQSLWNRTGKAVRVYTGSGGSGSSTCFAPGAQAATTSLQSGSAQVLATTSC